VSTDRRPRLVVVPSDALVEYERNGFGAWLERYYNPGGFFAEVHVVSPRERGRRRAHGMAVHGVPEREFASAVRALDADVVRAYGAYWPADLVTRRRVPGVPVVVSAHDSNPAKIHRAVRYADLVVAVSGIVARRVIEAGADPARVRVLPNRVDRAIFRRVAGARPGDLDPRVPPGRLILHVGRRAPQKNLDTVIRALALLPADHGGVFVGGGDVAPYARLAADLGVADRCAWIDAVDNHDLPRWYSACDCFCVPSRWEGFGIVFVEAAACGAPIVTSDIAPMNEYLAHDESACLVADFESPAALAAAIRRVCEDREYARRIGAGAARVAERFDRVAVDRQEIAIYREALALPRPPLARRLALAAWPVEERVREAVRAVVPETARDSVRRGARVVRERGVTGGARAAAAWGVRLGDRAVEGWARSVRRAPLVRSRSAAPPARALAWLRDNELPDGGIRVHADHPDGYPEVSGYLVPTLLAYGETALATRLLRWLVCIQRGDGGFTSPDGIPHVFDTAQALRGLLAGAGLEPAAPAAARRAAAFLRRAMVDDGGGGFGERYRDIPGSVHLYALPPLAEAARVTDDAGLAGAVDRCLRFYLGRPDTLDDGDLTHFLAYRLEALIELGQADVARPVLAALARRQREDGGVPGRGGVGWVCVPGLAQIAGCWYRVGWWEPADRAMAWLERHQTRRGGFRGSEGPGADYFPGQEPAWAVKFYLDAHRRRVSAFMARQAAAFPAAVSPEDGRAAAVLAHVRPGDRVIELGCGKGRFLAAVRARVPDAQCTGVDLVPDLLAALPDGVRGVAATLERVPCAGEAFDVVFGVEAVEHSANLETAVAEMVRLARPGGVVVVVDKERRHTGRLPCPPWEAWPADDAIRRLLGRGCDGVTAQPVTYDGHPADGLMVAWTGRKRARLTGAEWSRVLIGDGERQALVGRVRRNHVSPWAMEVLLATAPGQRVLEIGSGTGEISLALALAGREVTVLDLSPQSLAFVQRGAADLGVRLRAVGADAARLPFAARSFDVVWSSGLLEHFTPDERRALLAEWARVAAGRLVNLVPNAASLAYRLGKAEQEESGRWAYGVETPIASLREDLEAAGLRLEREYSVGARHALAFLRATDPLRRALARRLPGGAAEPAEDLRQGYLLVAVAAPR